MKRQPRKMEKLDQPIFQEITEEQFRSIVGGEQGSFKATGEVTGGPMGGDWKVDTEIDFE